LSRPSLAARSCCSAATSEGRQAEHENDAKHGDRDHDLDQRKAALDCAALQHEPLFLLIQQLV